MLVGRDRSIRNWSPPRKEFATGRPGSKGGDLEERIWNFDNPAAAKMFKSAIDSQGLTTSQWSQHRSGARVQNFARKFSVLACLGLWNTRVTRVVGRAKDPGPCGRTSHGLDPSEFWCFGITVQKTNVVSGCERGITEICTVLLAGVLEQGTLRCGQDQTHVQPKASVSRSKTHSSPHPPSQVVCRACHDSRHERTTIPENTSFEWNGLFTQRVTGYWYGSY